MIKHWFTLIWNRKHSNFLLMLEMFIAFLVICILFVQGTRIWTNYQEPLGYEYENVWSVSFSTGTPNDRWVVKEDTDKFYELKRLLESFKQVKAVAGVDMIPFTYNNSTSSDSVPGRKSISIHVTRATDDYLKAMNIRLIEGEWFNESHDALNFTPMVITKRTADELFPGVSPIGKEIFPVAGSEAYDERYLKLLGEGKIRKRKVVGIIENYRKYGALFDPIYMAIQRTAPADSTLLSFIPGNFVVKVDEEGMSGAFEEKMTKALERAAPSWSFSLTPIKRHEERRTQDTLNPLISFALIAGFLIIMIGLGMVGVLWQSITARRPEIGLRRALGATKAEIFGQITGELIVIASFSMLLGSLVFWQFPLLNIIDDVTIEAYMTGWVLAMLFLYAVTAICGLYPSMMATGISPTEALHDE